MESNVSIAVEIHNVEPELKAAICCFVLVIY